MMYLSLVSGLVLLLASGDLLVRGAARLAMNMGVAPLMIGLTVVAFGTSAPELVISVRAATEGATGIAIGNVVGSNIANILLVLGVPAIIYPIRLADPTVTRNTVLMLGATAVFVLMCFYGPFDVIDGVILLALLGLFLVYTGWQARRDPTFAWAEEAEELAGSAEEEGRQQWRVTAFIVAGVIGLPIAAELTINGATDIARTFAIPDTTIALTAIAIGTSLPELATTLVCAFRRVVDMGVGNVLGSNIFNLFGVLGAAAVFAEIPVPPEILSFNLWVMVACALIVAPFALAHASLGRIWGAVFLASYGAFLYFVFQLPALG